MVISRLMWLCWCVFFLVGLLMWRLWRLVFCFFVLLCNGMIMVLRFFLVNCCRWVVIRKVKWCWIFWLIICWWYVLFWFSWWNILLLINLIWCWWISWCRNFWLVMVIFGLCCRFCLIVCNFGFVVIIRCNLRCCISLWFWFCVWVIFWCVMLSWLMVNWGSLVCCCMVGLCLRVISICRWFGLILVCCCGGLIWLVIWLVGSYWLFVWKVYLCFLIWRFCCWM